MFGFPFFTSLIVTIALVIAFSFAVNKGITKKKSQQNKQSAETGSDKTDPNCHA